MLQLTEVYDAEPERDAMFRTECKQETRLPLRVFQEPRDEMRRDPVVWERETACPLEIKLIASLRYLAVGASSGAFEDVVNVSRVILETERPRRWWRSYPEHTSRVPACSRRMRVWQLYSSMPGWLFWGMGWLF